MKVHLMFRNRDLGLHVRLRRRVYGDVDAQVEGLHLPRHSDDLVRDLGLETMFAAMAGGDSLLHEIARFGVLTSLEDPDDITYRQAILRDCLARPDVVTALYDTAFDALSDSQSSFASRGARADLLLSSSVSTMTGYVECLQILREIAREHTASFESEGFKTFFSVLMSELDDGYFDEIHRHLDRLRFRGGVLVSANLGPGDVGRGHVLRRSAEVEPRGIWTRLGIGRSRNRHGFELHPRDDAGARALAELRTRGIGLVADALAQAVDHVQSFLVALLAELAFYRGCMHLHDRLVEKGEPICFPQPLSDGFAFTAHGLYDGCSSLLQRDPQIGNDVRADGKSLVMITGANQGGKSTLMRAMGIAQVMMQAGMFGCGTALRAGVCRGIFTHYKREEDATMQSGKLDEELRRMSELADLVVPGSLVLFNESFSATNEREGSEIARQVIDALRASGVKVVFVTHQHDLARSFYERRTDDALFLRAQRGADTHRTFRLEEAEPLPTSHGEDLYWQIFGEPPLGT